MNYFSWSPVDKALAQIILRHALEVDADFPLSDVAAGCEAQDTVLSCYAKYRLVMLRFPNLEPLPGLFLLWDPQGQVRILDGTSGPVFDVNDEEGLLLRKSQVLDYVKLFCFAVRREQDAFVLTDMPAEADPSRSGDRKAQVTPTVRWDRASNRFVVKTRACHLQQFYAVIFAVSKSGVIMMQQGTPSGTAGANVNAITLMPLGAVALIKDALRQDEDETRSDKTELVSSSPLHSLVELLLASALGKLTAHRLIENFHAAPHGVRPLAPFAQMLTDAYPVIAVESTIPFVEEVIADIVQQNRADDGQVSILRGTPSEDDSTVNLLPIREVTFPLLLVPLYVCRAVVNLERLAHELATRDVAAIIACADTAALPDALRRLVDLTIRLPELDTDMFAELFRRVIGEPLPDDWNRSDLHWVRQVSHTDFEHPRRRKLRAQDALMYIRGLVEERLRSVDVSDCMSLAELHGLGEAREFAEDLIHDIHSAIRGDIKWTQVDRGALLVGPPGTGKTTLARAIAKDCGVRFLTASAASWIAMGDSLGPHIRAIRASFAEARRYAPSILFIDEVDGLGNREQFTGKNAQYSTEVVNAVLEEIQTIDPRAPFFVLAATNFVDRVDPALRRSGRLDRVITIPLPNGEALASIYRHFLQKWIGKLDTASSIDIPMLGLLSLGLAGADVEKIVRGATRRARKRGGELTQEDLIAEITNKSRSEYGQQRLLPEEIERTAFHESGHAMALYFSARGPASIGFITIIPRPDGSLGFVAQLPDGRVSLTRRDYIEKLEVILAGRAAEEVRYGREGVSGGAGRDLHMATSIAATMLLQLGFGEDRRLAVFNTDPSQHRAEIDQILTDVYEALLVKLKTHWVNLDRLATRLIARQEMTGTEVTSFLQSNL